MLPLAVLTTVALAAPAPADFTARVTNPYFPLVPGMRWEYRGVKDGRALRDVVAVTSRVERIRAVPCAVVRDRKWYVRGIGEVKEATVKGGDERPELVSFRRP